MITLGIETSCDETSIALLETSGISADTGTNIFENPISYRVLGHTTFSQIDIHAEYGGVFPVLAKREHSRRIVPLLLHVIKESGMEMVPLEPEKTDTDNSAELTSLITSILAEKEPELLKNLLESKLISHKINVSIDQIAVTNGPGLEPALWVGVNFARALGVLWNIPVIPTNHMEGHIVGSLLSSTEISSASNEWHPLLSTRFPAVALLVSGGHTELIHVKNIGGNDSYNVLGRTRDDAIGEAFDKVARMMNIPYPGGPKISELATAARENFSKNPGQTNPIILPRPMLHSPDLDFSFSGLKTSVLYLLQKMKSEQEKVGANETNTILQKDISNIALAFEDAVTEVLVAKTKKALDTHESHALIVGGGVIANQHIRTSLTALAQARDIPIFLPPKGISGDNALMIALAGALHSPQVQDAQKKTGDPAFSAQGNLSL